MLIIHEWPGLVNTIFINFGLLYFKAYWLLSSIADLNEVEKIPLTPIMFFRIRLTLDYGACFFGVRKVVSGKEQADTPARVCKCIWG